MELISKYKSWFVGIVTALVMGGGWMYDKGSSAAKQEVNYELIEGRIFESPQQMVKVVTKVEQLPTDAEIERQRLLDSIAGEAVKKNNLDAIASRARRDKRDSLNAVTLYQMKKAVEELEKNN